MRKLYKMISSVLAAALLCSLMAGAAFGQEESVKEDGFAVNAAEEEAVDLTEAQESAEDPEEGEVVDISLAGLKFTIPKEYQELNGVFELSGGRETEEGTGICETFFMYYGFTWDDYYAVTESEDASLEDLIDLLTSMQAIAVVYSINQGRGESELREYLEENNSYFEGDDTQIEDGDLKEIGKADDVTFYLYQYKEADGSLMKEGYREEFQMLYDHPEYITDNLEFFVPKEANVFGTEGELHFETTDVFGNKVTSEELFGDKKVTMLNIWTTWCVYCLDEMEELEEISKRAAEKDCAVVGILQDGTTPQKIEEGIALMEEYGVTYTVILPWEGFDEEMTIIGYPTTLFADSEGRLLGDPIVGAYVDQYEPRIDEELAAMER